MEVNLQLSIFAYTALAFLIPVGIFKVNQWLQKIGEPNWKKAARQQQQQQQQQQQKQPQENQQASLMPSKNRTTKS